MKPRKRFVLVGTGHRAMMYLDALVTDYASGAELAGLCDTSTTRMNWQLARLKSGFGYAGCPTYTADAFDRMVRERQPDSVIVCTTDATHHLYIVRALELGCDVITEKPMTTDERKAALIRDAIEATGRRVTVTFNMRYAPLTTEVYRLLRANAIGRIKAIGFDWMLDTSHGADYFRRWHRDKSQSGGLLVHKSTHHFDMLNWWVQSSPRTVYAMGDLAFYGHENAKARGETYAYDRYTGQTSARSDPFSLPLDGAASSASHSDTLAPLRGLYLDAESETGYLRDRNVFSEGVTSEDTLAVLCRYDNGVILNYSLVAYSPWKGYRCAITGDRGRIEIFARYGSHTVEHAADGRVTHRSQPALERLTLHRMFEDPREVAVPKLEGGHAGADPQLLEHLFSPSPPPDPLGRGATHDDGFASLAIAFAANRAIAGGGVVDIDRFMALEANHAGAPSIAQDLEVCQ